MKKLNSYDYRPKENCVNCLKKKQNTCRELKLNVDHNATYHLSTMPRFIVFCNVLIKPSFKLQHEQPTMFKRISLISFKTKYLIISKSFK